MTWWWRQKPPFLFFVAILPFFFVAIYKKKRERSLPSSSSLTLSRHWERCFFFWTVASSAFPPHGSRAAKKEWDQLLSKVHCVKRNDLYVIKFAPCLRVPQVWMLPYLTLFIPPSKLHDRHTQWVVLQYVHLMRYHFYIAALHSSLPKVDGGESTFSGLLYDKPKVLIF
jgi:hypothetical protein